MLSVSPLWQQMHDRSSLPERQLSWWWQSSYLATGTKHCPPRHPQKKVSEPGLGMAQAHSCWLHCWQGLCSPGTPPTPPLCYGDVPRDRDLQRLYSVPERSLYAFVLLHWTGTKTPRSEQGSPELAVSLTNALQRQCCQWHQYETPILPAFRSRHWALALFSITDKTFLSKAQFFLSSSPLCMMPDLLEISSSQLNGQGSIYWRQQKVRILLSNKLICSSEIFYIFRMHGQKTPKTNFTLFSVLKTK